MTLTIDINGQIYTLDDEVLEALQAIAKRNGVSLQDAIAQSVVNEKLLEDQVDQGGELLVKNGGEIHRLEYA
jgi:hypothetical protein